MISLVAAYANGRVIGKAGQLPWHLPADSRYFKQLTMGHTVVMGRKTFDSMGQPLPGRRNVVMTGRRDFSYPGVEVVHDVAAALALADTTEFFVVGGEDIYRQFLPFADRLYITEIELEVAGDTFFPAWDERSFRLISQRSGHLDARNTLPHTYLIYERIAGGKPDRL